MKKFLLLLTTMVLLFVFSATCLAEAKPYTIWDIPWDTTKDEIVDVVFTRTGIELEAFDEHSFRSSPEQQISILGQDVDRAAFGFIEYENYLDSAYISYSNVEYSLNFLAQDIKTINNGLTEIATPLIHTYEALYNKYGACDISLVAYNNDAGDRIINSLKPIEDPEDLAGLAVMALTHRGTNITLGWYNVALYVNYWVSDESLTVLAYITYGGYDLKDLDNFPQTTGEIDITDYLLPKAVNIGL